MSNLNVRSRRGVLSQGWSAEVGDYAIAGGWCLRGEALVVGDAEGGVYAFNGESGETVWAQNGVHELGILAFAVHPNGSEFATAGQDGKALIWNAAERQVSRAMDFGNGWVENVAWSPDGKRFAASCSRQVRVYGADGGELWRHDDHPSTVSAIAWSSAGDLATACYGQVTFLDGSSGAVRQKMEWQGSLVSMVLSADGGIVACGSQDNSVHFWRRSTGQDSMMTGYPAKPSALAFDDTGTLLATGGGEAIMVWSFHGSGPEGTRPGVLEHHIQPITTLAFAPGEMRLASGGRDGAVAAWSLQRNGEGRQIGTENVGSSVSQLYWRHDGQALAALNAQGGVTVWKMQPEPRMSRADRRRMARRQAGSS